MSVSDIQGVSAARGQAEEKLRRQITKMIHEGKYAAHVDIECWYDERWSPTSTEHARKLERVRLTLRHGDIAEAAKDGQVFELTVAVDGA